MTITIRNTNDAQARRTFARVLAGFTGWTYTTDTIVANGVVAVTRITAADWDRSGDLYEMENRDRDEARAAFDVRVRTDYYTCATMLGVLTPKMRERAEIDGRPARAVCDERNAHHGA